MITLFVAARLRSATSRFSDERAGRPLLEHRAVTTVNASAESRCCAIPVSLRNSSFASKPLPDDPQTLNVRAQLGHIRAHCANLVQHAERQPCLCRHNRVIRPLPVASRPNQSRATQRRQVTAHVRLRRVQRVAQVAHACLSVEQQVDQSKARRISKGPEQPLSLSECRDHIPRHEYDLIRESSIRAECRTKNRHAGIWFDGATRQGSSDSAVHRAHRTMKMGTRFHPI
jgi:hypothetical protein